MKACESSQFANETYNDDLFQHGSSHCQQCHESCATCDSAGADKCTACKNGQYLDIPADYEQWGIRDGSCKDKQIVPVGLSESL